MLFMDAKDRSDIFEEKNEETIVCGTCGYVSPSDSKFCALCGSRIGPEDDGEKLIENEKVVELDEDSPEKVVVDLKADASEALADVWREIEMSEDVDANNEGETITLYSNENDEDSENRLVPGDINDKQDKSLDTIIPEDTLQEIYNILIGRFPQEKELPIAQVWGYLNTYEINKNSLGVNRMTDAGFQMSGFMDMTEKNSKCILHIDERFEARRRKNKQESIQIASERNQNSYQRINVSSVLEGNSNDTRNGEYVYAKYVKYYTDDFGRKHRFESVDGFIFTITDGFKRNNLYDLKVGEYAWFMIKDSVKHKVYYQRPDSKNIYNEAASFRFFNQVGDIISRPISEKTSSYIQVELGPTMYTRVSHDELITEFDYDSFTEGKIYNFEILSIEERDGKTLISLVPVSRFTREGRARNIEQLPDSMKDLSIPAGNLERIVNTRKLKDALPQMLEGDPRKIEEELRQYINEKYLEQKKEGTLVINNNRGSFRIDIDMDVKDINGVPLKAMVNKNKGYDRFALSQIGSVNPGTEMERFVYIDDWRRVTKDLADLALPEKWDYSNNKNGERHVLKQYLRFTYYKASLDSLVVEENGEAIFNTGLVDHSYNEIYCYLKKNTNINDPYNRKWTIGYFACRSVGKLGKDLNTKFVNFPPAPTYIRRDRLETLFFDTEKQWEPDYEHILAERLDRFPDEFIRRVLSYDATLVRMIDEHVSKKEIQQYVNEHDELKRDLQRQLQDAKDIAIKYCKWNYKTAIPMYYPRINNISLLLPLNLSRSVDRPADVALVVELLPNGNYQGQTILTLQMAYNDSRLICRPNSEWLTLEQISEGSDIDEDVID